MRCAEKNSVIGILIYMVSINVRESRKSSVRCQVPEHIGGTDYMSEVSTVETEDRGHAGNLQRYVSGELHSLIDAHLPLPQKYAAAELHARRICNEILSDAADAHNEVFSENIVDSMVRLSVSTFLLGDIKTLVLSRKEEVTQRVIDSINQATPALEFFSHISSVCNDRVREVVLGETKDFSFFDYEVILSSDTFVVKVIQQLAKDIINTYFHAQTFDFRM